MRPPRQRFTRRETLRTLPTRLSIGFVVRSDSWSRSGSSSSMTVSVWSRPSRREAAAPGCSDSRRVARASRSRFAFQLLRDPTRRKRPCRIAVDQNLQHHSRIESSVPTSIALVALVESTHIHRLHRIRDEKRKMTLRKPVSWIRRKQTRLVRTVRTETRSHNFKNAHSPDFVPAAQTPSHRGTETRTTASSDCTAPGFLDTSLTISGSFGRRSRKRRTRMPQDRRGGVSPYLG